jgi:hypothetical protein
LTGRKPERSGILGDRESSLALRLPVPSSVPRLRHPQQPQLGLLLVRRGHDLPNSGLACRYNRRGCGCSRIRLRSRSQRVRQLPHTDGHGVARRSGLGSGLLLGSPRLILLLQGRTIRRIFRPGPPGPQHHSRPLPLPLPVSLSLPAYTFFLFLLVGAGVVDDVVEGAPLVAEGVLVALAVEGVFLFVAFLVAGVVVTAPAAPAAPARVTMLRVQWW